MNWKGEGRGPLMHKRERMEVASGEGCIPRLSGMLRFLSSLINGLCATPAPKKKKKKKANFTVKTKSRISESVGEKKAHERHTLQFRMGAEVRDKTSAGYQIKRQKPVIKGLRSLKIKGGRGRGPRGGRGETPRAWNSPSGGRSEPGRCQQWAGKAWGRVGTKIDRK